MISDEKCKVMVYLNKELNSKADEFAKELGISKSALFQLAVAEYMSARNTTMDLLKQSFDGILKLALENGGIEEVKKAKGALEKI